MSVPDFDFETIFTIKSDDDFNRIALKIFQFQAANNEVYNQYLDLLKCRVNSIDHYSKIPFLPISFFKTHNIFCGTEIPNNVFYSSGTTGEKRSQHFVSNLLVYDQSLLFGFELTFGPVSDYCIFALLPSYHENKNSSLLYMTDKLIKESGNEGGFYLENVDDLLAALQKNKNGKKTILIGVSYALLDLAQKKVNLSDIIVIETGGMKGRRKEMIKSELHAVLKKEFHVGAIGSEYGMTELLSQAWSKSSGLFNCPPWMKILIRDYNDPLSIGQKNTGGINVIDLANVYSCSFIATQDLGKTNDNQFEVIGRFDNADLRGCNLLIK